jgi:hypothetical protein
MAIIGFKSKKDEVLNHWIGFVDNFNVSPTDFYDTLEKLIDDRRIPGLEKSRVEYPAGGLLSEDRLYLRLIRERLAFDTCAVPFGTGCFFSCRTIYSPPVLRFWHVLVLWTAFGFVFHLLDLLLGWKYAWEAMAGLLVAIAITFRNTIVLGLADVDAALLKIPALGPFYDRFFRRETYYREDARLSYEHAISTLVRALAEEMAAAKGVKLLKQFERAPVLGSLYREVPSEPTFVKLG